MQRSLGLRRLHYVSFVCVQDDFQGLVDRRSAGTSRLVYSAM